MLHVASRQTQTCSLHVYDQGPRAQGETCEIPQGLVLEVAHHHLCLILLAKAKASQTVEFKIKEQRVGGRTQ